MNKSTPITAVVVIAVFAAIFGAKFHLNRQRQLAMASFQPPPVTVSAAAAQALDWPNTLEAIGSLASHRGIMVRSELAGTIRRIAAVSGDIVDAGAVLVEIDTSVEAAQLAGLEAQARLAQINFDRARLLRENGTNSPSDLDAAEAALALARSAVEQLRATIAKKHIVAPFAGRLGIVQVHPGQLLGNGDPVVVLESIDPIHLDFAVPQQELGRLAADLPVRFTVDAFPGRTFAAHITAISPCVSVSTRDVDVRATLANPDEVLRPGMYARLEVVFPASANVVAVPTAAVVHNPYGDMVYVIEQGAAQQRFIQTGPTRGNLIMVASGLQAGDQVVTSGQIKLRNGRAVQINNTAAPSADPAPRPAES